MLHYSIFVYISIAGWAILSCYLCYSTALSLYTDMAKAVWTGCFRLLRKMWEQSVSTYCRWPNVHEQGVSTYLAVCMWAVVSTYWAECLWAGCFHLPGRMCVSRVFPSTWQNVWELDVPTCQAECVRAGWAHLSGRMCESWMGPPARQNVWE
jgi:hypothetical protein